MGWSGIDRWQNEMKEKPMSEMIHVVVAAAGSSRRMKEAATVNKPYLMLRDRPVLAWSLTFFEKLPWVQDIVIVAAPEEVAYCRAEVVERYALQKVIAIVPGGRERQESVLRGLSALPDETGLVAVHDSARPFLDEALCLELCDKAGRHGAAIPGVVVKDTIKEVDENGWVKNTPDRSALRAIQTPQVFRLEKLLSAYRAAQEDGDMVLKATDDAMLYEKYAGAVHVVDTVRDNLKITTPDDWAWAKYRADILYEQEKEEK